MNIVILVRILWTGGSQKIAIKEAEILGKLGHNVRIVFLRESLKLGGYYDLLRDVKYEIVCKNTPISHFSFVYDFITSLFMKDRKGEGRVDFDLIRGFPGILKESIVDLVVCHDQYAGMAGFFAKKKLGIPYVVVMHERVKKYQVRILGPLANYVEKMVLKQANSVISLTEKIGISIKELYGLRSSLCSIGITPIISLGFKEKKNYIISASMWDEGRKPDVYLDIIKKLPDYIYLHVGNWRSETLYQSFLQDIRKRKLDAKVKVIRNIKEDELNELYQQSKFSVRFGFGEVGIGMSIIESINNGTPVIMNDSLGSSDLISQSGVGLVVEPNQINSIIEFINKYDDLDGYNDLQLKIRNLSYKYTWEKHANCLIANIKGICSS